MNAKFLNLIWNCIGKLKLKKQTNQKKKRSIFYEVLSRRASPPDIQEYLSTILRWQRFVGASNHPCIWVCPVQLELRKQSGCMVHTHIHTRAHTLVLGCWDTDRGRHTRHDTLHTRRRWWRTCCPTSHCLGTNWTPEKRTHLNASPGQLNTHTHAYTHRHTLTGSPVSGLITRLLSKLNLPRSSCGEWGQYDVLLFIYRDSELMWPLPEHETRTWTNSLPLPCPSSSCSPTCTSNDGPFHLMNKSWREHGPTHGECVRSGMCERNKRH